MHSVTRQTRWDGLRWELCYSFSDRSPHFGQATARLTNVEYLFAPAELRPGRLVPRWLWLRALGLIFLSAFHALAFQIHGLIGEHGILPARGYLADVAHVVPGLERFWLVPSLLWIDAGDAALTIVVAAGIICSLLLVANIWPRAAVALCTLLFLSCVVTLQDFSSYQSDGMLLEAGFLSIFFAPGGFRPGTGASEPPSRAALFLLQWEWFRIHFESGVVKLASGDPGWRNFTAMDEYYQNGPFPTWIGWYVQHWPHWYHAMTVGITLIVELVAVWALFLPRKFRIACFVGVSALQIGIIATANYAFLNYLRTPPPIFAPYQPRFDWNLWFASLAPWQQSSWVVLVQARLLENDPTVLSLFRGNPFPGKPPVQVRTVLWQYWFTSEEALGSADANG